MLRLLEALYVYEGKVEDAAVAVGDAVGVRLELHDSSYFGGDYYRAGRGLDEVILLENFVDDDDDKPFFVTQPVGATCVGSPASRTPASGLPKCPACGPSMLVRGLLFGSGVSVTSDAVEKVPTGRRADSL